MKKLGIVVPTYNRCEILKTTLAALLPQVENHIDNVEIVVSDNASQDGTRNYMEELIKEHPCIKYYRHNKNGGYLFNFKFGIKEADCEYIFLHGDDDLTTPYFVDYALHLLEDNPDVELFHFNYFISAMDGTPIRMEYPRFETDQLCYRYDEFKYFISNRMDVPSFMSSNIFRKCNWDSFADDEKQYECIGYQWLYIMYRGSLYSKCMYIETPFFIQRMSNVGGYSTRWALYSIVGIARVFENLGSEYYSMWKSYKESYSLPKTMRNIASVYMDKPFYKKNYKLLKKYLHKRSQRTMLFICLYILPTFIERFIFEKAKKILAK